MTTDLSVKETFEQKITERIRKDIGELMPDEVLRDIVTRATENVFFQRVLKRDQYGRDKAAEPSWAEQVVKNCLMKKAKEVAETWMSANNDRILALINEQLEKGVLGIVRDAFLAAVSKPFDNFAMETTTAIMDLDAKKADREARY